MMRAINWRLIPRTEQGIKAMFGPPDNPNPAGRLYAQVFKLDLTPQPIEELVRELREAEVKTVLSALDNESTYGYRVETEEVADLVQRFPDCFIPFSGADPHKGSQAVAEVERAVREFGFKGVDLQPFMQQVPVDDAKYYPIYAVAEKLGVVVFVACSAHYNPTVPMDYQHPRRLDQVAIDFPNLKLVARHAGWPWVEELVAVAMRHANIYFELSGIRARHLSPTLLRYIDSTFAERTVWGVGHLGISLQQNVEEFLQLPLRDTTKEKVLLHNSLKLLELEA
jgi:hypothetical protein